jgi:hypothetical protein
LKTKLKINADFEAGKWTTDIRCELGIPPRTVRITVADKQNYKDVAKVAVPGRVKCFRTREDVLFKTGKLLLIWISDQQAKGDNMNSTLIRQKARRIFCNLKASL